MQRGLPRFLKGGRLPMTAVVLVATMVAATHAQTPATRPGATHTQTGATTSRPAAPETIRHALTTPGTDRVEIPVEGRARPVVCWIYRPEGYAPGQKPPLMVCLHGTDDTAEEMVSFWRARRTRIPTIIASPQGVGKGWCSEDEAAIRATFDWLAREVWYDDHRVLLAGWSAGGAMTFQMVYKERVAVTAAVALANYVPPRLTVEDIRPRRDLPIFYAVGMADVNHELMRAGLDYMRSAGANVELYHPTIGHVLSPEVAQAALNWFDDLCSRQTGEAIETAAKSSPEVGPSAQRMEDIANQSRWNDPGQVTLAAQVLAELNKPGRAALQEVEVHLASSRPAEAVELLRGIERMYGSSSIGVLARVQRERLEADPQIRAEVEALQSRKRAEEAMQEYARAQKFIAENRLPDAAQTCRKIIDVYGGTPAADRAGRLLRMLEGRSAR